MRVLIAGGGTGGHVYPAIAIGQELIRKYDADIAFIGNTDSFESVRIKKLGWLFYDISIQGFRRDLSLKI